MLDIILKTPFQFLMFLVFLSFAFAVRFSKTIERSAVKQRYRFPDPCMPVERFRNLRAFGYIVESGLWLLAGYMSLQSDKKIVIALISLWFVLDMAFLIVFTIFTEDCVSEA